MSSSDLCPQSTGGWLRSRCEDNNYKADPEDRVGVEAWICMTLGGLFWVNYHDLMSWPNPGMMGTRFGESSPTGCKFQVSDILEFTQIVGWIWRVEWMACERAMGHSEFMQSSHSVQVHLWNSPDWTPSASASKFTMGIPKKTWFSWLSLMVWCHVLWFSSPKFVNHDVMICVQHGPRLKILLTSTWPISCDRTPRCSFLKMLISASQGWCQWQTVMAGICHLCCYGER